MNKYEYDNTLKLQSHKISNTSYSRHTYFLKMFMKDLIL
jgi:hypothetical protein